MSAIGGIFRLDGDRVRRRDIEALGQSLAARGSDGGREILRGSIAMAFRAFCTTPESRDERQPSGEPGPWMLTFDGRIDNRDDLRHELGLEAGEAVTDSGIVLAVCRRRGAEGVSRIVGDFALAAWDERSRSVWLARDPFGARPLFYHADDGVVTWASDLNPLVAALGFTPEIDEHYIASYLAAEIEPARSPFVGIHSVPPGYLVRISSGGIARTRFWSPIPRSEVRYRTDADYEEAFRHLFREAVRCRLRSNATVWSELSGGFDSSSIVVTADDLLAKGQTNTRVDTVSYVFDRSSLSNELAYLTGVEEQRGRAGLHIFESECPILAPLDADLAVGGPSYLLCFASRHMRLCRAMRDAGARVLLCGHGGDSLLWSHPDAYVELADHLAAGRVATLHRRTLAWSRALSQPYTKILTRGAFVPNLPPAIARGLGWSRPPCDFLNSGFIETQRPSKSDRSLARQLPSKRERLRLLDAAISIAAACYYRELGAIEVTCPFLDRRLVEFLLAIPFDQIVRPGTNRSLHRRAFQELLPESVRRRRSKRAFDEAFYRGLAAQAELWRPVLQDSQTVRRGWVRRDALMREFERALTGRSRHLYILMKVLALEMWLRELEERNVSCRVTARQADVAVQSPGAFQAERR